jgi:Outer membrane efflux protein/WD domain, G-beta repeat
MIRLTALSTLLLAAGFALGQPPAPKVKEPAKPAAGSLEETLEKTLRNSADIKAAEAKVREAEAQLNQVRQQVLTKATALHSDLNLAKRMLAVAEKSLAIVEQAVQRGTASQESLLTAQAMAEKHRGEVEKLQTELKSLRGEFAHYSVPLSIAFSPDGRYLATGDNVIRLWDVTTGIALDRNTSQESLRALLSEKAPAPVQNSMSERVKKFLDQEVDMTLHGLDVQTATAELFKQAKADIVVRVVLAAPPAAMIDLKGKLTVGAWLQAIEDTDPNLRIVVRDYGLLVSTRDRVPDGALRVQDLWKGNAGEVKKPEAKTTEKK